MKGRQKVEEYLGGLGFEEWEARVYVVLVEKGPLTLLEASRVAGVERTKLYRSLEDLRKRGLIELVGAHKTTVIKAAKMKTIEHLVREKLVAAKELEQGLEGFEAMVESIKQAPVPTQVTFFRGKEGIEQMAWNVLGAKREILSYCHRVHQEAIGQKKLMRWAEELVESGVGLRELQGMEFRESLAQKGYEPVDLGPKYKWRVLPDEVMKMTHSMDIYDDKVAIYQWSEGEWFGVEIANEAVAKMQRGVFEVMWGLAGRG